VITKVLVFAGLRELLGGDIANVDLREGATYATLVAELAAQFPNAVPLLEVSRIAAGGAFVAPDTLVNPNVEIAIIPPVSGG
jgi:molybdopterin converting factor small subunit